MKHVRGAPYHPQAQIGGFIAHSNRARYHESLENVTPANAALEWLNNAEA